MSESKKRQSKTRLSDAEGQMDKLTKRRERIHQRLQKVMAAIDQSNALSEQTIIRLDELRRKI
ncbi:MAG TPA: hypothetical protein VGD65_09260 [Chryseosolibacter sp.]